MLAALGGLLDQIEPFIAGFVLVFVRVGALTALLPGFGEQFIPVRIRLIIAFAFALLSWPMLAATAPQVAPWSRDFFSLMLVEAAIGLAFGISLRLMIMVLQLAGSIAAQSTALTQVAGVGVTPDPMPAIGNILTIAGMALALMLDMHIKVVGAIVDSYSVLPFGAALPGGMLAEWGVAHVARAFALAFSLAAPFVIASFAYNLALGAINRAMPQLMVAFIGAPAITGGTLVLLLVASPVILGVWSGTLDSVLADPFGPPQ